MSGRPVMRVRASTSLLDADAPAERSRGPSSQIRGGGGRWPPLSGAGDPWSGTGRGGGSGLARSILGPAGDVQDLAGPTDASMSAKMGLCASLDPTLHCSQFSNLFIHKFFQ